MNKGFVILAVNTSTVDYVSCAKALEHSIKNTMPEANVTIITELPYGDQAPDSQWKLINDWQVYEASPYEYTIKLEADMYIPQSIDYWWEVLKHRDLVLSTTIRNFKQEVSKSRAYRKFIDDNNLPDVYNAITYFKKSDTAKKFFELVKFIFENWNEVIKIFKCKPDEIATTDWVYAIAAHILGSELTTMPDFKNFGMVHMKQYINDLPTENWTDTLIYEIEKTSLRINTFPQTYPVHYHIKSFAKHLGAIYAAR